MPHDVCLCWSTNWAALQSSTSPSWKRGNKQTLHEMTSPPRQWRRHNEKVKEQNERLVSDVGGSINMWLAHFGCTCRNYSSLLNIVLNSDLYFILHQCKNMIHLHILPYPYWFGTFFRTNSILEILPQSWIPAILKSRKYFSCHSTHFFLSLPLKHKRSAALWVAAPALVQLNTLSSAPHPVLSQIHSHNIFRLHAEIKCPNHDINWRSSVGIFLETPPKNQTSPTKKRAWPR